MKRKNTKKRIIKGKWAKGTAFWKWNHKENKHREKIRQHHKV
jgi:hypothetical protein